MDDDPSNAASDQPNVDPDVAALLERVPERFVVVEPADLEGTATAATPAAPDAATERARDLLADAPRLEVLTPVVLEPLVEAVRAAVLGGETALDVVLTGNAVDVLEREAVAAALPLLADREDVSVAVHGGDAPFAVLVRPDVVGFAVAGEDALEFVFESDGDAARTWAQAVLEGFRSEATPLG